MYPDEGNVFLWADVTVKNIGTESGSLVSGEIIYDGQYKYQQSDTAGDAMIYMKPLSAPAEGALIFEVSSVVMESDEPLVLNIGDVISYTIRDSNMGNADVKNEEQPETEAGEKLSFDAGISFPILQQGYQDGNAPCPVMTQENTSGVEKYGTYEEMMASLIDDGATMYPAPAMERKAIYVPIKWDAPTSLWYDGLLTYNQFLNAVEIMGKACEENGMEDFYSSCSWEALSALSGKWSNGADEISISIYSDSDSYGMWDEIGTISSGGNSGTVHLFGVGNDGLYIFWSMDGGDEAMFRYLDNGKLELWNITDESIMEKGGQFECVERFES